MPRVEINGKIVDFPNDLTHEQLKKAVSSAASQIGQQGIAVPKPLEKAAEAITTPIRGFRGLGVGAQRLMSGINLPALAIPGSTPTPQNVATMASNFPLALERAAEATKKGYTPTKGERTGALLGETAAITGLTAPLAMLAPQRIAAQAALEGAMGGGVSALSDISETGRFFPKRTASMAALGAGLPLLKTKAAQDTMAKAAGMAGRIQSGVEQREGARLFKDPGAFLSPPESVAGAKLGASRAERGLKKIGQSVKETVSPEATESRKYVEKISEKYSLSRLGRSEPPTSSELLKAKQSLNKIIEATPLKQRETRAELFELKNKVDDVLEKSSPGEKSASREYARSALAGKFRKILPVTKSGDVSLTRTIGLPAVNDSLVASLGAAGVGIVQSPFLGGAAISGAGAINKAVQQAIKTPAGRQVVQSITRFLTEDKAKEYLKKAKKQNRSLSDEEQRKIARQMAVKDGWEIPE